MDAEAMLMATPVAQPTNTTTTLSGKKPLVASGELTESELVELAQHMASQEGVPVFHTTDAHHRVITLLTGEDAVSWLLEQKLVLTSLDGINLCQRMLLQGHLKANRGVDAKVFEASNKATYRWNPILMDDSSDEDESDGDYLEIESEAYSSGTEDAMEYALDMGPSDRSYMHADGIDPNTVTPDTVVCLPCKTTSILRSTPTQFNDTLTASPKSRRRKRKLKWDFKSINFGVTYHASIYQRVSWFDMDVAMEAWDEEEDDERRRQLEGRWNHFEKDLPPGSKCRERVYYEQGTTRLAVLTRKAQERARRTGTDVTNELLSYLQAADRLYNDALAGLLFDGPPNEAASGSSRPAAADAIRPNSAPASPKLCADANVPDYFEASPSPSQATSVPSPVQALPSLATPSAKTLRDMAHRAGRHGPRDSLSGPDDKPKRTVHCPDGIPEVVDPCPATSGPLDNAAVPKSAARAQSPVTPEQMRLAQQRRTARVVLLDDEDDDAEEQVVAPRETSTDSAEPIAQPPGAIDTATTSERLSPRVPSPSGDRAASPISDGHSNKGAAGRARELKGLLAERVKLLDTGDASSKKQAHGDISRKIEQALAEREAHVRAQLESERAAREAAIKAELEQKRAARREHLQQQQQMQQSVVLTNDPAKTQALASPAEPLPSSPPLVREPSIDSAEIAEALASPTKKKIGFIRRSLRRLSSNSDDRNTESKSKRRRAPKPDTSTITENTASASLSARNPVAASEDASSGSGHAKGRLTDLIRLFENKTDAPASSDRSTQEPRRSIRRMFGRRSKKGRNSIADEEVPEIPLAPPAPPAPSAPTSAEITQTTAKTTTTTTTRASPSPSPVTTRKKAPVPLPLQSDARSEPNPAAPPVVPRKPGRESVFEVLVPVARVFERSPSAPKITPPVPTKPRAPAIADTLKATVSRFEAIAATDEHDSPQGSIDLLEVSPRLSLSTVQGRGSYDCAISGTWLPRQEESASRKPSHPAVQEQDSEAGSETCSETAGIEPVPPTAPRSSLSHTVTALRASPKASDAVQTCPKVESCTDEAPTNQAPNEESYFACEYLRCTAHEVLRRRGVDPAQKESYLSPSDFRQVFNMSRDDFVKLPLWRQQQKKKLARLF
ncbi:uncharacterized protein MONBRDRAFT_23434 [Monosiga brevicollis MX1]|uniref:HP domain-containing protein n=1 Tax=Monosiga brevicollis TaxID=81824 RepID=A9UTE0_MONBE|nr:uncharacterized protein MONBRDRAFT_23434 [Monosiga brevicollis MX1]EDQ91475.1 predicted protein [Monosiga brevicollis MX1]|eukprot:XP_001743897.1 hypothetical protein [Monosiga brevicollis MX1]